MKRTILIVVSTLALAGLLVCDIGWPKASLAEESPAARAAATPEAAANLIPKETIAETSASATPGAEAEEASDQNIQRSAETAPYSAEPGSAASSLEFPAD